MRKFGRRNQSHVSVLECGAPAPLFSVQRTRANQLFHRAALAFILLVCVPVTIRADAINLPILLGYGAAVLIPLLAFQVFVESLILKPFLGWKVREFAGFVLRANIWSVVAGIPTQFLNGWIYESILATNLYDYMRLFPSVIAVGSCVYYVVTVAVEWFVLRRRFPDVFSAANKARLWVAVGLANLATYGVCAPIFYHATKPKHDITEFTSGTEWTKSPAAKLLYIDSASGHLRTIRANGLGDQSVVPFAMRDYMLSDDLQQCFFRGIDDRYYHFDRRSGRRSEIECARTNRLFISGAAFSPSGKQAAILANSKVILENLESHKTRNLFTTASDGWFDSINWSTNEFELFLTTGTNKIAIDFKGLDVEWMPITNKVVSLFGKIGRILSTDDDTYQSGGDDWGLYRSWIRSKTNGWNARIERGLGSSVTFYRNKKERVYFGDNPGWIHLGSRPFYDIAMLNENEALFSDAASTYLVDLTARRIGRVALGIKFTILNDGLE